MRSLVVANWKCNPTSLAEAKRLFNSIKKGIKNIKNAEVVICPPFVYLSNLLTSKPYTLNPKLGAQNCFWEEKGAFTGEISAKMLKNLGCEYVIIGHSERERYFGETNETANKKIKAAISAKLKPILCIGETEKERKTGKTNALLKNQLIEGLKSISNLKSKILVPYRNEVSGAGLNLIVAYEPVWAVGTGKPCGISEAKEANLFIRKLLHQLINSSTHKLLYGGSINSKNARDYIKEAKFDGLLIGGASLNSEEFVKIVKNCAR